MEQRTGQEDFIIRYLFGELSEEEETAVEERFLTDNQFFEQMLSTEDALMDAYVKGELPEDEREKVETSLLVSRRQLDELAFVKDLVNGIKVIKHADTETAESSLKPRRPGRWPWSSFFSAQVLWSRFAIVSLSILSLFLLIWSLRLHNKFTQIETNLEAREKELLQRIDEQNDQNNELARNLEVERGRRDELEQKVAALQTPGSVRSSNSIATLFLTPDSFSRGNNSELNVVNINPDVNRLQINIDIGGKDTYTNYIVEIKTFEGRKIWGSKNLRPTRNNQDRIVLTLPARLFANDYYTLVLSGHNESGEGIDIADYSFRVKK